MDESTKLNIIDTRRKILKFRIWVRIDILNKILCLKKSLHRSRTDFFYRNDNQPQKIGHIYDTIRILLFLNTFFFFFNSFSSLTTISLLHCTEPVFFFLPVIHAATATTPPQPSPSDVSLDAMVARLRWSGNEVPHSGRKSPSTTVTFRSLTLVVSDPVVSHRLTGVVTCRSSEKIKGMRC